jgi:hypothetical protein
MPVLVTFAILLDGPMQSGGGKVQVPIDVDVTLTKISSRHTNEALPVCDWTAHGNFLLSAFHCSIV